MSSASTLCWALVLLLAATQHVFGTVLDRCAFVSDLQRNGVTTPHVISNWVCLVEAESGRDTSKLTTAKDKPTEYGVFQIKSPEWCTPKVAGGRCNIKCEDLLNENLGDDIACAQKVYKSRNSFSPWEGWKDKCRGKPLTNVSACLPAT